MVTLCHTPAMSGDGVRLTGGESITPFAARSCS